MNALLGSDAHFLLLRQRCSGGRYRRHARAVCAFAGRWQRAGRSARSTGALPQGDAAAAGRSRRRGPPAPGDLRARAWLSCADRPAPQRRGDGGAQEHTRRTPGAQRQTPGAGTPEPAKPAQSPWRFAAARPQATPQDTLPTPGPSQQGGAQRIGMIRSVTGSRDAASPGFARGSCPAGPASQPRPCRRRTPEPLARARRRMGRPHAKSGAFGRCRGPRR